MKDFLEYDTQTDIWTKKADFGGAARSYAVGFSIGTKGYIGTVSYNDFWEWDQSTNLWTRKANFGSSVRESATAFSIGTKGYIGMGSDYPSYFKDFFEFNQCDITLNTGFPQSICSGFSATIGLPTVLGNTYNWTSTPSGFNSTLANPSVNPTIATTYNLSQTNSCGTASGSVKVTVNPKPVIYAVDTNKNIVTSLTLCRNSSKFLTARGAKTYTVTPTKGLLPVAGNDSSVIVKPSVTTTYTTTGTAANGCKATVSGTVIIIDQPVVDAGQDKTILAGQSVKIGSINLPATNSYNWTSAPAGFSSTIASPTVTPTITTTFTMTATGTNGCKRADTVVITVQ